MIILEGLKGLLVFFDQDEWEFVVEDYLFEENVLLVARYDSNVTFETIKSLLEKVGLERNTYLDNCDPESGRNLSDYLLIQMYN